jgi:hypothetical protein
VKLVDGIEAVDKEVNKAGLEAAVAQAQGFLKSGYTEQSWAVLMTTALTQAIGMKNNANATQSEVNTTLVNLLSVLKKQVLKNWKDLRIPIK